MSMFEVKDSVARAMRSGKYDFVMCNFAPPDMVGHTGVYDKTEEACAHTDKAIGESTVFGRDVFVSLCNCCLSGSELVNQISNTF